MASRQPPDLVGLIERLSKALVAQRIPFMLIGGQAVLVHGQPRLTEDIDVTLGVDPGQLDTVLDAIGPVGLVPLPADLSEFVTSTFVLPAHHEATGLRVDLIFSSLPYERQAIDRAVYRELGAAHVPFASAEDLLIHKLFAGRARDLEDAIGVIRRQHGSLDWGYVERWVAEFAGIPGREELPVLLERLRKEAN